MQLVVVMPYLCREFGMQNLQEIIQFKKDNPKTEIFIYSAISWRSLAIIL
jgi:hypothetical protein